ncbi:peptidase domain-containing ABC transporter [Paenibacillus hexagrammi]|uniref:Peptidase domain-containing ABC transporter n=1 Tax=Paenibacillus hexagrammi TaxID=2908839 RepID=A0ABY3SI00_9BACL|nr:peptidase domain-containing ABC transporter [Paenibacillus sp. YPD9-1]UJF33015.1 peptidase domain-containing ABC transporter [Paenibacillus sp. YPD9-1]
MRGMERVNENSIDYLHNIALFDVFSVEEKLLLAHHMQRESYKMGQTIVDKDGSSDSFYIIVSGKARKIGHNAIGKETNLGLMQPGEHFGEHILLQEGTAPPFLIRASTDLDVLRISRVQFQQMITEHPTLDNYFREFISSDILRSFLKNNTVLTHVDHAAIRSLLDNLEVRTYEGSEYLVREGDDGDAFYILKSGTAWVEKGSEGTVVNRLYPGDFFGELALLTGEPRKASIRAAEPVTVFRLAKSDFDELIRRYPVILESIRRISAHYTANAMLMVDAPDEPESAAASDYVHIPDDDKLPSPFRMPSFKLWRRRYPALMQQNEMDCGPTCLTMISRYHGMKASVNRMRERCNVGVEGTSMLGLIESADALGFETKGIKATTNLLSELPTPFIAHWNGNHYIVVYEVRGNSVTIADPGVGYLDTVTIESFGKHWTGYVITLEPTSRFTKMDEQESLWGRYMAYFKPFKKLMLSTLALSVMIELIFLIFPIMTQQIFDRVLNDVNLSLLHVLLIAMLTLTCVNTAGMTLRQLLLGRLAYVIDQSMLENFYRQLFRLPYTYFTKRTSGDILTRVYENERIRSLITDHAIELLLDVLTLFVYGGLMIYYHFGLALISLTLMPIYIGLYMYMLPKMRINFRKQMGAEGESQTHVVESINAIATVKGLSMEKAVRSKLMSKLQEQLKLRLQGNRLEAYTKTAATTLRSISNLILLYFGSKLVMEGQLSVGELVAYTVLFTSFMFALESISQRSGELSGGRISMERLNDVFESTPEHPEPEKMRLLPTIQGHIRFENVSYQYYRGGKMILQNLDLEIQPGQSIALVGRSGSGKSTIANLLLKLLEPSSGAIYIDGYPLREVHAASIRRQVGVVQQETVIFRGTVRDNIALNNENVSFDEVERAARLAGAHEFIEAMPLSYDTMIGEGGIRLSGGSGSGLS